MTTKSKMGESDTPTLLRMMCAVMAMDPRNRELIVQAADELDSLREQLSNALQDAANISFNYGKLSEEMGELKQWNEEARLTLHHLSAMLQKLSVPYRVDWREWIALAEQQLQQSEAALRDLRDHFVYRYCRTKKEGVWYDLPEQVIAANKILDAALSSSEKESGKEPVLRDRYCDDPSRGY